MRWVHGAAAVATAALAGCNQIYGLEDVKLVDAPVLEPERIRFSAMVADIAGGAPGEIRFEPLAAERVAVGVTTATLMPATIEGTDILVPLGLPTGEPFRLEYKLAGKPAVEVQYAQLPRAGNLAEPIFGRLERTPLPAGSKYAIDIVGAVTPPAAFNGLVVTTGLWMQLPVTGTEPFQVDLHAATSLSGPLGAPDKARGDTVELVHFDTVNCRNVAGAAVLPVPPPADTLPPLVDNQTTTLVREWRLPAEITPTLQHRHLTIHPTLANRVSAALGSRSDLVSSLTRVGNLPHDKMPALTSELDGIPVPVMTTWTECRALATAPDPYRGVAAFASYPRVALGAVSDTRTTASGAVLTSSIAAVRIAGSGDQLFSIEYAVPFAVSPFTLGGASLDDPAQDGSDVAIGDAELELRWGLEQDPGLQAPHSFEVVIYRIAGGTLDPVRVYVKPDPTEPSVRVDPSIFVRGSEYVIAVRARRGTPFAVDGDFTMVEPQQSVTTVFTRTFTAR